jgi:hypothetical protein
MKDPQEIRNELISAFLTLDEHYREYADSEKISYLDIEISEKMMQFIKTLMYHYQEEIPEMRVKRKWGEEMIRAEKLLKKYAESVEDEQLKLNSKFDSSGYLELREFFEEAKESRAPLKKKIM